MAKKTTTILDEQFKMIAFKYGTMEKTKKHGKEWLIRKPLTFGELKDLAADKGLKVTKETNKQDVVDFFI